MVPHDIEPMTTAEALATTFMMMGGLLIAAFIISSFTSAFASMDSKKQLAGKQLDLIRNYLLLKAVPTDLRARVSSSTINTYSPRHNLWRTSRYYS